MEDNCIFTDLYKIYGIELCGPGYNILSDNSCNDINKTFKKYISSL